MWILLLLLVATSCATHAHPEPQTPTSVDLSEPPAAKASAPKPSDANEDAYLAVPRMLDAINRARATRGVAPVRLDRALCAVAQQGLSVFSQFGGLGSEQRTADALARELDRFHYVYPGGAKTAVLMAPTVLAVATLQPAMEAEVVYVGIAAERLGSELAAVLIFAH